MTSTKTVLSVALLAGSLLAVGCSGAPSDVGSTEEAVSASKTLSGTYEEVGTNSLNLPYYSYDFKTDGKYTATGGCKLTGSGPHCFAITSGEGTYKIKNGKITLDDSSGTVSTFFITYGGNTVTWSKTESGSTAFFFKEGWTREIPIGDVCQDDNGNSLGECEDSGNFACGLTGPTGNVYTCTPLD